MTGLDGDASPQQKGEEEILLRRMLQNLLGDFDSLNKAINFNEENPRKLTSLVNARQKVATNIFYCVSLLRDPRLKITGEDGKRRDLARLIQRIVETEKKGPAQG